MAGSSGTLIDPDGPTRSPTTQLTHNVDPGGATSLGITSVFWGTGVGSVTTCRALSPGICAATASRTPGSAKVLVAGITWSWKKFSSSSERLSPRTLGMASRLIRFLIRMKRRGAKITAFTSNTNAAANTTLPQVVSVQLVVAAAMRSNVIGYRTGRHSSAVMSS